MPTEAHDATLPMAYVPAPASTPHAVRADAEPLAALAPTLPFEARRFDLVLKRTLDIVGAGLLLLLVLPLFAICAIGVKLSSPGPIWFRQTRVGRGGRPFTMLKFRTYPVDHVDDVIALPVDNCPSWWGRLLRRTSVDELPQLINVLKGDMSLVGPRPERPHIATPLVADHPDYRERHRVPAGITGLAQIRGLVGTTSIADRVRSDNEYIEGWRFSRDLVILLKTIPAVIRKLHW